MSWVRRFVLFHRKRHPSGLSGTEVSRFLTHLAVEKRVSASTQNQALSALVFLYRSVLRVDVGWLTGLVHARRSVRVPVVLSPGEVNLLLGRLAGTPRVVAQLLYGSGMRLLEALRLRVLAFYGTNEIQGRS